VIEGWYGNDHLILFDEAEIASASDRYAVSQFLPGYKVIGLRGWDNFILQDSTEATYCAPTIPAVADHISRYALPSRGTKLSPDIRFQGKRYQTDCIRRRPAVAGEHHLGQSRPARRIGQVLERPIPISEQSMLK
jgi:hypothetical protein